MTNHHVKYTWRSFCVQKHGKDSPKATLPNGMNYSQYLRSLVSPELQESVDLFMDSLDKVHESTEILDEVSDIIESQGKKLPLDITRQDILTAIDDLQNCLTSYEILLEASEKEQDMKSHIEQVLKDEMESMKLLHEYLLDIDIEHSNINTQELSDIYPNLDMNK